jgi:hypothetical protein
MKWGAIEIFQGPLVPAKRGGVVSTLLDLLLVCAPIVPSGLRKWSVRAFLRCHGCELLGRRNEKKKEDEKKWNCDYLFIYLDDILHAGDVDIRCLQLQLQRDTILTF